MSLEAEIKSQYEKFFSKNDSGVFKLMAEYYLRKAVTLKTKDIEADETLKLLLRNIQKRLFIGIGSELLLKAFFLRNGYCINTPQLGYKHPSNPPYFLKDIPKDKFDIGNTFTFNQMIDQTPRTEVFIKSSRTERNTITKALKIAKVFRNKEGHVATLWHEYDSKNYSDIESGLVTFYKLAFSQKLEIQFSFEKNEMRKFTIESV